MPASLFAVFAGRGDALFLVTSAGKIYLVDGGPRGLDPSGRSKKDAPYYHYYSDAVATVAGKKRPVHLSGVVLSHAHEDHYGGLLKLLEERLGSREWALDGSFVTQPLPKSTKDPGVAFVKSWLDKHGFRHRGDLPAQFRFSPFSQKPPSVFTPPAAGPERLGVPSWTIDDSEDNVASVLMYDPDTKTLFTGDGVGYLIAPFYEWLTSNGLSVSTFKVPHHGSRRNSQRVEESAKVPAWAARESVLLTLLDPGPSWTMPPGLTAASNDWAILKGDLLTALKLHKVDPAAYATALATTRAAIIANIDARKPNLTAGCSPDPRTKEVWQSFYFQVNLRGSVWTRQKEQTIRRLIAEGRLSARWKSVRTDLDLLFLTPERAFASFYLRKYGFESLLDFYKTVRANTYLVSANGTHGHPSPETLAAILAARSGTGAEVMVTDGTAIDFAEIQRACNDFSIRYRNVDLRALSSGHWIQLDDQGRDVKGVTAVSTPTAGLADLHAELEKGLVAPILQPPAPERLIVKSPFSNRGLALVTDADGWARLCVTDTPGPLWMSREVASLDVYKLQNDVESMYFCAIPVASGLYILQYFSPDSDMDIAAYVADASGYDPTTDDPQAAMVLMGIPVSPTPDALRAAAPEAAEAEPPLTLRAWCRQAGIDVTTPPVATRLLPFLVGGDGAAAALAAFRLDLSRTVLGWACDLDGSTVTPDDRGGVAGATLALAVPPGATFRIDGQTVPIVAATATLAVDLAQGTLGVEVAGVGVSVQDGAAFTCDETRLSIDAYLRSLGVTTGFETATVGDVMVGALGVDGAATMLEDAPSVLLSAGLPGWGIDRAASWVDGDRDLTGAFRVRQARVVPSLPFEPVQRILAGLDVTFSDLGITLRPPTALEAVATLDAKLLIGTTRLRATWNLGEGAFEVAFPGTLADLSTLLGIAGLGDASPPNAGPLSTLTLSDLGFRISQPSRGGAGYELEQVYGTVALTNLGQYLPGGLSPTSLKATFRVLYPTDAARRSVALDVQALLAVPGAAKSLLAGVTVWPLAQGYALTLLAGAPPGGAPCTLAEALTALGLGGPLDALGDALPFVTQALDKVLLQDIAAELAPDETGAQRFDGFALNLALAQPWEVLPGKLTLVTGSLGLRYDAQEWTGSLEGTFKLGGGALARAAATLPTRAMRGQLAFQTDAPDLTLENVARSYGLDPTGIPIVSSILGTQLRSGAIEVAIDEAGALSVTAFTLEVMIPTRELGVLDLEAVALDLERVNVPPTPDGKPTTRVTLVADWKAGRTATVVYDSAESSLTADVRIEGTPTLASLLSDLLSTDIPPAVLPLVGNKHVAAASLALDVSSFALKSFEVTLTADATLPVGAAPMRNLVVGYAAATLDAPRRFYVHGTLEGPGLDGTATIDLQDSTASGVLSAKLASDPASPTGITLRGLFGALSVDARQDAPFYDLRLDALQAEFDTKPAFAARKVLAGLTLTQDVPVSDVANGMGDPSAPSSPTWASLVPEGTETFKAQDRARAYAAIDLANGLVAVQLTLGDAASAAVLSRKQADGTRGFVAALLLGPGFRFGNLCSALSGIDDALEVAAANVVVSAYRGTGAQLAADLALVKRYGEEMGVRFALPFDDLAPPTDQEVPQGLALYAKLVPAGGAITQNLAALGQDPGAFGSLVLSAFIPREDPASVSFLAQITGLRLVGGRLVLDGSLAYAPAAAQRLTVTGDLSLTLEEGGTPYLFQGALAVGRERADFTLTAGSGDIDAPFGMDGISIRQPRLVAAFTFPRDGGGVTPRSTILVTGEVLFRTGSITPPPDYVTLHGQVVFRDMVPCIAAVALDVQGGVDVLEVLANVLAGANWPEGYPVLRFQGGLLYLAHLDVPITIDGVTYQPGYHLAADLTILGGPFRIDAQVRTIEPKGLVVTGSSGNPLGFVFAQLTDPADATKGPSLTVDTTDPAGTVFKVTAGLRLFQTSLGAFVLGYQTGVSAYIGSATYQGPITGDRPVTIGFRYTDEDGLSIERFPDVLSDLQSLIDLAKELQAASKSSACGQLVDLAFDKAVTTKCDVTLARDPRRPFFDHEGLHFVVTGTYTVSVLGDPLFSLPLPELSVVVPSPGSVSMHGLADWIASTLVANAGQMAQELLKPENLDDLRNLIAVMAATSFGPNLVAALVCRGVETPNVTAQAQVNVQQQASAAEGPVNNFGSAAAAAEGATSLGALGPAIATAAGALGLAVGALDELIGFAEKVWDVLTGDSRKEADDAKRTKDTCDARYQGILGRLHDLLAMTPSPALAPAFATQTTLPVDWTANRPSKPGFDYGDYAGITYDLEASLDASFDAPLVSVNVSGTTYVVSDPRLANARTVYVRVRARYGFEGAAYDPGEWLDATPASHAIPLDPPASVAQSYDAAADAVLAAAPPVANATALVFDLVDASRGDLVLATKRVETTSLPPGEPARASFPAADLPEMPATAQVLARARATGDPVLWLDSAPTYAPGPAYQPLAAPQGVAGDVAQDAVQATWNPVPGADGYDARLTDERGNVLGLATVAAPPATLPLPQDPGDDLRLQARARSPGGGFIGSAWSPPVSLPRVPGPTGLASTVQGDRLVLTWTPMEGVTQYQARLVDAQGQPVGAPVDADQPTAALAVPDSAPAGVYRAQVRGVPQGTLPTQWSSTAPLDRLAAPQDLVAPWRDAPPRFAATWTPVAGAHDYLVRLLDADGQDAIPPISRPKAAADVLLPDDGPTGLLVVCVLARAGLPGVPARAAGLTRLARAAPSAVPTRDALVVSWSPIEDAGAYDAQAVAPDGSIASDQKGITGTGTKLQPLQGTYAAKLRATPADAEHVPGGWGRTPDFTLPPYRLLRVAWDRDALLVEWESVPDAARYSVEMGRTFGSNPIARQDATASPARLAPPSTLKPGSYEVWVRAYGADGAELPVSPLGPLPVSKLAPPTGVSGQWTPEGFIASWTPGDPSARHEAKLTAGTDVVASATAPAGATQADLGNVDDVRPEAYVLRIRALDPDPSVIPSDETDAQVAVGTAPTLAPLVVQDAQVTASWDGADPAGYQVEIGHQQPDGSWQTRIVPAPSGAGFPLPLGEAPKAGLYRVRVRALPGAPLTLPSPWSGPQTFAKLAAPVLASASATGGVLVAQCQPGDGATSYEARLRRPDGTIAFGPKPTDPAPTLAGLAAGTYTLDMRALATGALSSDWSDAPPLVVAVAPIPAPSRWVRLRVRSGEVLDHFEIVDAAGNVVSCGGTGGSPSEFEIDEPIVEISGCTLRYGGPTCVTHLVVKTPTRTLGPFGGLTGTPFNYKAGPGQDLLQVALTAVPVHLAGGLNHVVGSLVPTFGGRWTRLTIRSGDVVDAITLADDHGNVVSCGGTGGVQQDFSVNEPIVEVSGLVGPWHGVPCLAQVTFKTPTRTFGPFGTLAGVGPTTPFTFAAAPGQDLTQLLLTAVDVQTGSGTATVVGSLQATFGGRWKKLVVRSGDILDGIGLVDGNGNLTYFGGQSGGELEYDLDEPILEVSGATGSWYGQPVITQLLVKTATRTFGPFGTGSGVQSSTPFRYVSGGKGDLATFSATTRRVRLADGSETDVIQSLSVTFDG